MIVQKVGVGNLTEAFIEKGLSNSLNIISSDDNNKGKTILIQSILYTLGNTPAFPASFIYDNYYHYIQFTENDKVYKLCRKGMIFILKTDTNLMILNGITEFKRYWNKHISAIPIILKDGQRKLVDPELFLQLFFIGQDKKDTSNIINYGYYKKEDFFNMLCAFVSIHICDSLDDIDSAKTKLGALKENKSLLLKKHKVLTASKNINNFLSPICDKVSFERKIHSVEKIQEKITEIKKNRNQLVSRKLKYQETLKELRSLNRTIDHGEVRCLDCNSTRIGFNADKKATCSFDISTPELRNSIIASIEEKIDVLNEELEKATLSLNDFQSQIKYLLEDENITLEAIIAYKQEFIDASGDEKKILEIDSEIKRIEQTIKQDKQTSANILASRQKFIASLIDEMNRAYKEIDPVGNFQITDLFSEKGKVISGSEATVFYLAKLYAIAIITKHKYPIVIDSFRAEDLSSMKEDSVIDMFAALPVQKIFTTTLKKEEVGKYDNDERVHHVDYTNHSPSKMLNECYLDEFCNDLQELAIEL